jgi:hypothetical protein
MNIEMLSAEVHILFIAAKLAMLFSFLGSSLPIIAAVDGERVRSIRPSYRMSAPSRKRNEMFETAHRGGHEPAASCLAHRVCLARKLKECQHSIGSAAIWGIPASYFLRMAA